MSLKVIAKAVGCAHRVILRVLCGAKYEAKLLARTPAPGRLSIAEREEILLGLARGESMSAIARGLGRSPSTVTREVAATVGPANYRIGPAHLCASDEAESSRTIEEPRGVLNNGNCLWKIVY